MDAVSDLRRDSEIVTDLHTHPSNCETVRLQAKHFNFSPDPPPGRSPASGKYIKVSLKKGEHGLNGESPISQAYTLS